jgi:hypothetical protein
VSKLSPARQYHAATFLERGVAVPFTTPLLGGTRARPVSSQRVELIVRNPSGGSGVYVMPWSGITSLYRPTLHDKVLNARIAALGQITPASIRGVARSVAVEGLAGEQAMAAAQTSAITDASDRKATNHQLLVALIRQVNVVPDMSASGFAPGTVDLDTRARQTILWLAPRLGQSLTWAFSALDEIGAALAGVGVVPVSEEGRIPRLTAMLSQTKEEIGLWCGGQRNEDRLAGAHMVCSVAELTLALTEPALTAARNLTLDMVGMLRSWAVDWESVIRLATLPEWLLDGWEQICMIWNYARDDASRCAALAEIVEHLPILPREVRLGGDSLSKLENLFLSRRPIGLNEDWRTGAAVFDLIDRNERFRAMAA